MNRSEETKRIQERREQLQEQLHQDAGREQFFRHLLENFAYRYLSEEKGPPAEIHRLGPHLLLAQAEGHSFKRSLEVMPASQREELKGALKEGLKSGRPTQRSLLLIDTQKLDEQGQGLIKVGARLSWDFYRHENPQLAYQKEYTFKAQDWDHVRKHFPLLLEEACELF